MTYTVSLRSFEDTYLGLEPLYRRHYGEMRERMSALGVETSAYNPRLDEYVRASRGGYLLTFVLEADGDPVGYCNVYITNDMHNRDLIAREDAIYVVPEHRHGAGRMLAGEVHKELKRRGVLRMDISTSTDLRVAKWLQRQGYKHTAHCMTITFKDKDHVRS